jgi:hypothetical protein
VGCAQTDPASVCNHIATLQHGSDPAAVEHIKDYNRRCVGPMTEARLSRPEEYRCWSKCMVDVASWPDTVRCDGCVGSNQEFELFQLSKTRKKAEQARDKEQKAATPSASSSAEGGSCAEDAACGR